MAFLRPYNYEEVGILYTYEIYEECRCTFSSRSMFQNGKSLRIIVIRVMNVYCILDYKKITALHARGLCARVSVNFRKFSPCIARAGGARGFDSLPSLSDVGTFSFR